MNICRGDRRLGPVCDREADDSPMRPTTVRVRVQHSSGSSTISVSPLCKLHELLAAACQLTSDTVSSRQADGRGDLSIIG